MPLNLQVSFQSLCSNLDSEAEKATVCKQYGDAFRKARFSVPDLNVKETNECNL